MFLVEEKKKLTKMILKKVYISRGEGGGQGQFGKSLHFEFFFFMTASLRKFKRNQKELLSRLLGFISFVQDLPEVVSL